MDAPDEFMCKAGDHEEHLEIEEVGEVLLKIAEAGAEHPYTPAIIKIALQTLLLLR